MIVTVAHLDNDYSDKTPPHLLPANQTNRFTWDRGIFLGFIDDHNELAEENDLQARIIEIPHETQSIIEGDESVIIPFLQAIARSGIGGVHVWVPNVPDAEMHRQRIRDAIAEADANAVDRIRISDRYNPPR